METIKLGSKGKSVSLLQRSLHLAADGIFGPITEEAVRDFQSSHGLAADGVVGSKTWAALGVAPQPSARRIDEILIHCAATPEGQDFTVKHIRQWHLARNFSDIGYHFVIYRDGSVHKGRPLAQVGAHCPGHNSHSIGICYIGGCAADGKTPKDTRTPAQRAALCSLIKTLHADYPGIPVHGHNEFAAKACPSFDVRKELHLYKD